jgi:cytochrome c oxidase subunit 1
MIAIFAISGLVAIVGGAAYILITVGSLLWGKKLEAGSYSPKGTVLRMPVATAITGHGSAGFAAPGTFVFAMVFLGAFVLYYFVNWKYLSSVWGLS